MTGHLTDTEREERLLNYIGGQAIAMNGDHEQARQALREYVAAAIKAALAPVRALVATCPLDPATQHYCVTLIAAHDLGAVLPPALTEGES